MKFVVFDSESDGLWKEATKLHVLSCTINGTEIHSTVNKDDIVELFSDKDTYFVAHNSIRHDMPLLNKLYGLGLDYKRIIDTLALSWYLNEDRGKSPGHGLESFGIDYGVPKPKITDWEGLTYEEYAHRCSEDVKINWLLWQDLWTKLVSLYKSEEEALRLCLYLSFKMDCLREQEEVGIRLDMDLVKKTYESLSKIVGEKKVELAKAMPQKLHYKTVNKPKDLYKKDGTLSVSGKKWLNLLIELKLPPNTVGPVKVVESAEEGNPGSTDQVKEWLYSLGWKPLIYKYTKDKKTGQDRGVAQVRFNKELCESVTILAKKDPAVDILDGLTVASHRLSVVEGYLKHEKNGWVMATAGGLTNTLRLKHRSPITNLPGVKSAWGKEIRSCLLPPEGCVWAGADMVSLEDTTKRHYMQPLDPKYVEEMMKPEFDPHLNLAVFAGAITQEQADKHMRGEIDLTDIRKKYKAANYSCVYGVGKAKLAKSIEVPVAEAEKLIQDYWKRNWAIKKVSSSQKIKIVGNKMWVQNPVSGFWHSLRAEKDVFSTLNQSTATYAFDTWLSYSRLMGLKMALQFHDEQLVPVEIGQEKVATELLKDAIGYANNKLKLNVKLDIDVQIGQNYGQVH